MPRVATGRVCDSLVWGLLRRHSSHSTQLVSGGDQTAVWLCTAGGCDDATAGTLEQQWRQRGGLWEEGVLGAHRGAWARLVCLLPYVINIKIMDMFGDFTL